MPSRILYLCAAATLHGCGSQAIPADETAEASVVETAQPPRTIDPAPDGLQTIDPAPENAEKSRVAEKEEIIVEGRPACAFSVQYQNTLPQPVTWRGEPCSALTAEFMSGKRLAELGKMDRLSAEALADVERSPAPGVFYVEGEFSASVYPLNVAGRIYEVPVAD